MIKIHWMPFSGLAEHLPCDASNIHLKEIIANISVTTPVMAALVSKGLKVHQNDMLFAVKRMEQDAVAIFQYLFQHILSCATTPHSFASHLNLAVHLDKEAFVAAMLSEVRKPKEVCVTAETISMFYESISMLNPAMIQTLSHYSPLWLRIKMFLSAFYSQKLEMIPFLFEIVPCVGHNFAYITRPLTTIDKLFDISKVLKYCATIVSPCVLAVKMAVSSQRMTPLLKCVFFDYMLRTKNMDIKHIQSGLGGADLLRYVTEQTLKSGESVTKYAK